MTRMRLHVGTAIAAIMLSGLMAAPAQSGQAELDLLTSYIGKWSGAGVLVGGKEPESFRCRLTVAKGNQAKINYAGRCSLVNMNLSVSGTIAFNDATRRYEAAMSSNAGSPALPSAASRVARSVSPCPSGRSIAAATTSASGPGSS